MRLWQATQSWPQTQKFPQHLIQQQTQVIAEMYNAVKGLNLFAEHAWQDLQETLLRCLSKGKLSLSLDQRHADQHSVQSALGDRLLGYGKLAVCCLPKALFRLTDYTNPACAQPWQGFHDVHKALVIRLAQPIAVPAV